jgi:hypothetical protein
MVSDIEPSRRCGRTRFSPNDSARLRLAARGGAEGERERVMSGGAAACGDPLGSAAAPPRCSVLGANRAIAEMWKDALLAE